MNPSEELLHQLFREEIEQAREMTFAQKFLAGAELFDSACEVTKSGIRMENPQYTEEQVLHELRRRLELAEKLALREEALR